MNILFLGPQGSGKSTQAQFLASDLAVPYISAGSLIRQYTQQQSKLGKRLKERSEKGELVDDADIETIMNERLSKEDIINGFILDGYPRERAQLNDLLRYLESHDKKIDKVFYLDLPDLEGTKRLIKRKRVDDTEEAIKKRYQIFHQKTQGIIDFFKQHSVVEMIDAQPSIENIHYDIAARLNINSHVACKIKN
jgi:adenylate kinase